MPWVNVNGLRFFYQRMGGGQPTVVFAHGLVMDNLSSWWYTMANATAARADVLCYDLRGHGLSERPPSGYGVADSVADLLALLDALGIDGPIHLVGNSYGGVIGLALAVAAPERVAGLVLVEAHASVEGQRERERAQLAHGLDLAGVFLDDDDVNSWLDTVGGRKLNRMAAAAKALIYDTTLADDLRDSAPFTEEQLAGVTCPVLLVYGEHSDIFSRAVLLERLLPRVDLHVVAGIDHSVLMGATAEVRRLVLDWVRDHGSGGVATQGAPGAAPERARDAAPAAGTG
jgi:pimeloyl-ACP methyl ester carboxylesterase